MRESNQERSRLCVISPCRDEAEYVDRAAASMVSQTVRPDRWVIVDDGSTDGTSEKLDALASQHEWVSVVHRHDRGFRQLGGGVVAAFNEGLRTVDLDSFDYVCKHDLDIILPSQYFETVLVRMEGWARLGSASGKPFYRTSSGRVVWEDCDDENSVGMIKLYRTSTFREIGGFVQEIEWDAIDCHKARSLGWRTVAWPDDAVAFQHLRPMGSSDKGILRGRMRHGHGQWYMGSSPLFVLGSAVRRLRRPPRVTGSAAMLWGYVSSAVRRAPRLDDPGLRRAIRRYQLESIALGKRRAAERWAERTDRRSRVVDS